MYRTYKYVQARLLVLACLSGVLGSGSFPVLLHAQVGVPAPDIANEVWLNSSPHTLKDLRGKVVMVEFWTFGCYNCRNIEPYVKEWHSIIFGFHQMEKPMIVWLN